MLDRLMSVIKAMFNKGMSKVETPEILAEQASMALESDLKQLREAITAGVTNEKMLEQRLKKTVEELETWDKRAATAVAQGNDEMAKQCLLKKQELKGSDATLESQIAEQKKSTAQLKERLADVEEKFREFQSKKKDLVARANASQAVANANEKLSSASGSSMDKWEQKIREKEARGDAVREVGGGGVTEDQFKKLDQAAALDDELAALKAKVTPKLIVDTGEPSAPHKEVVDENVPAVFVDVEEIKPDEK